MENKLKNISQNKSADRLIKIFEAAKYEPDPDFSVNIWRAIVAKDKHLTIIKLWIFSFVGLVSLGGLLPAIKILSNDLARSGFSEYFSLIFSDTGSVLSYWRELILSLSESLPVVSVVFTLSLLFICFLSFRYLMKQIDKNKFISSLKLSI